MRHGMWSSAVAGGRRGEHDGRMHTFILLGILGCGALCPRYARGCYGCFGPQVAGNPAALTTRLKVLGQDRAQIQRAFRFINGWAEAFRAQGEGDA